MSSSKHSDDTSGTFVHRVLLGPWDNFVYFIGDRRTRKVAVVDPAWHAPTILREAERLDVEITAMLCTHSHFDHVNAVEHLLLSPTCRSTCSRPRSRSRAFAART